MKHTAKSSLTGSMLALAIGCLAVMGAREARADDDDQIEIDEPAAHANATCASGHVCIHAGTTQGSSITNTYYNYACYKLYDQHGKHLVENHQTGEAQVAFYTGSNCEQSTLLEGWAAPLHFVENLEPANSVRLFPQ